MYNIDISSILQAYRIEQINFLSKLDKNTVYNFNDLVVSSINDVDAINDINFNQSTLIITSGDNDFRSPPINNNTIKKIFLMNLNFHNEKFRIFPIGIHNINQFLFDTINSNTIIKNKLLFANFSIETAACRNNIARSISRQFTFEQPQHDIDGINKYFVNVKSSMFNVCPPGNGIDSYRIWESIYLKAIPIIQRSHFAENIAKYFHIYIVDDWNALDKDELRSFYNTDSVDQNLETLLKFRTKEFLLNDNR